MEEATKIDNRSAKSIEEERREAEEKVTWISSTLDLDLLNSEKGFTTFSQVARLAVTVKGSQVTWSSEEEKVIWIFQKSFSTFPIKAVRNANSAKKQEISGDLEKGRQFNYSTENKTIWGARALSEK